jgi:hypothetical protein
MADDPDSPRIVAGFLSGSEALTIAGHLKSLGIMAHVWGANLCDAWPEVPCNIQVVVRHADVARAKEAISELRASESDGS